MAANGDLVLALKCPVCWEICSDPKIMPQCGHSIGEKCLKRFFSLATIDRNSPATVFCPECHSPNQIHLNNLETNNPLKRTVSVIRANEEVIQKCKPGLFCSHASVMEKADCVMCDHCNKEFCDACLKLHMEHLKLEVLCMTSGFRTRLDSAMSKFDQNAAEVQNLIEKKVRRANEQIIRDCDEILEFDEEAVLQRKGELMTKTKQIGDDLSRQLRNFVMEKENVVSQQKEIEQAVTKLSDTSPLACSFGDVIHTYKSAVNQGKQISRMENMKNSFEVLAGNSFQFVDEGLEMLAEAIEVGKTSANKPPPTENPQYIVDLRAAASSGDFGQPKVTFERVPSPCRPLIVQHKNLADQSKMAVFQAAQARSLVAVHCLFEEQDANVGNSEKQTGLHDAAQIGNCELLYDLIERGHDVNLKDKNGNTPIMLAVISNCQPAIEFLVEHGADGRVGGICGRTLLHFAAHLAIFRIFQILVRKFPELLPIKDDNKASCMHYAACGGNLENVQYLAEINKGREIHDEECGILPIIVAAHEGHFHIVEFLLGQGASRNGVDHDGCTLLHHCARLNNIALARRLIAGSPFLVGFKNRHGQTAQQLAESLSHSDFVKLFGSC